MAQGWLESDDDYATRMRQEAAERIIEQSTGSAPHQGFLESNDDYRSRVTQEANERVIEDSGGSAPHQGFFENDSDYRTRVFEEANARILEDSGGSSPRQGLFESNDEYRSRVFREANEATVARDHGSNPRQGWFESDSDYKRRVNLEAREIRAERGYRGNQGSTDDYSTADYADGPPTSADTAPGDSSGPMFALGLGVLIVVAAVAFFHNSGTFTKLSAKEQSAPGPVLQPFSAPQSYSVSPGGNLARVNERSGPGIDYPVIRKIERGTFVSGLGRAVDSGGVGWIALGDGAGYVKETLLSPSGLPSTSENYQASQSNSEAAATPEVQSGSSSSQTESCATTGWWWWSIVLCENPDIAELDKHAGNLDRIYFQTGGQPVFEDTHWQYQVEQTCKVADSQADCLRSALQARVDDLKQKIPEALASDYQSIFKQEARRNWEQNNW
ncbi:MAG TPA: hypothetical protein VIM02_11875 [Rhizomicrobium sp.]|jgi:hypothetical protein